MFGRRDPGACPICGAAHTACTASRGPVTAVQLPARDGPGVERLPLVGALESPLPLGDGSDGRPFSTGTYRGKKKVAKVTDG